MNSWIAFRAPASVKTLRIGLLCFVAFCAPAQGETIDCTPIINLPATIATQGIYCLTGNLVTNMTSGNAIEIQTNNVTIDLNGYKLGGLAAGDGTLANGIYAPNRKNITLRNGTIRGFARGVWLEDNSAGFDTNGGHLLEDLRFDGNTFAALQIEGPGNLIRRNQVVDTGGSTASVHIYGIIVYGPSARILDNDVDGTTSGAGGVGRGIYVAIADATIIQGNRVTGTTGGGTIRGIETGDADAAIIQGNRVTETTSTGGGETYGIYRSSGTGLIIEENIVINASATGTIGIDMDSIHSLCGNNRVRGFTTGINTCTDAGGNYPP